MNHSNIICQYSSLQLYYDGHTPLEIRKISAPTVKEAEKYSGTPWENLVALYYSSNVAIVGGNKVNIWK